jgi:NAD(P)-dependent dehydrogenase (short-subunit alcohol dehydrogenase family)
MRSVVLTGVSRGLGAALFDQLTSQGDRVLAIGRRFTGAQRDLATAHPDRVRLHEADLADPGQLPKPADLAEFMGTEPSVLVLNAGVLEPVGAVGALDPAAVASAVAVNLTAPMLLANAFLAARSAARSAAAGQVGSARILFISSGAAHRTVPGWAVYCATKRGAEMFFETLAAEAPDVAVANVNPGVMDTAMQATIRRADSFPERDRYVGLYERGELSDPADVARRIVAEHLSKFSDR